MLPLYPPQPHAWQVWPRPPEAAASDWRPVAWRPAPGTCCAAGRPLATARRNAWARPSAPPFEDWGLWGLGLGRLPSGEADAAVLEALASVVASCWQTAACFLEPLSAAAFVPPVPAHGDRPSRPRPVHFAQLQVWQVWQVLQVQQVQQVQQGVQTAREAQASRASHCSKRAEQDGVLFHALLLLAENASNGPGSRVAALVVPGGVLAPKMETAVSPHSRPRVVAAAAEV